MTLADLLKDIIDTSKERVKNPIISSFFLSFFIWNWRPIFFILFENTSMTNKIVVINSEYCKTSSILGPLFLAFFYTLALPYIMSIIDKLIAPAKHWRLNNLYESKKIDLENQISLVSKELELQDKKTRNKEKEDFENQIIELQNRIEANNKSHKAIIESYETKINEMTNTLNSFNLKNNEKRNKNFSNVSLLEILMSSNLSQNDFYKLHDLPNNMEDKLDSVRIGYTVTNFLRKNNLIVEGNDSEIYLTESGLKLRNMIVDNKIYSLRDIE